MTTNHRYKRKVFGRVRARQFEDAAAAIYRLEMRADGVYVRRLHSRRVAKVPFKSIINLAQKQPELFP